MIPKLLEVSSLLLARDRGEAKCLSAFGAAAAVADFGRAPALLAIASFRDVGPEALSLGSLAADVDRDEVELEDGFEGELEDGFEGEGDAAATNDLEVGADAEDGFDAESDEAVELEVEPLAVDGLLATEPVELESEVDVEGRLGSEVGSAAWATVEGSLIEVPETLLGEPALRVDELS